MTQVVVAAPASSGFGTAHRGGLRVDGWTVALAGLSAALVGLGWALGWRGVDLAAQLYRVEQFRAHGFALWDSQWYSGHWALDYSIAYPALAALVGVGLLAVLSAAVATAAFDRLLVGAFGPAGRLGSAVFAVSVIVETSIGQLAFFTGEAFGLASLWALLAPRRRWLAPRRRWVAAGALALASTAMSPLSGAFLALAMAAWCLAVAVGSRRRPASVGGSCRRQADAWWFASIGVLALAPVAVTGAVFPGQGAMPYPVTDWLWETVVALLAWVVAPRGLRVLRIGIGLYALVLLASVAVPSALGGNVGRMEDAFALPVVAACCWARRDAASTAWPLGRWLSGRARPAVVTRGFRIALAGLAVPLALSQWSPAWQALTANAGRSWTHRAYYAPVAGWLARQLDRPPAARAAVVPTLDHYQATYVAPSVPLARGWDRQLDEADNPLFYGKAPLTPRTYLAWLKAEGVRYVALADAPLDAAGVAEGRLLGEGVPGLRLVWARAGWRVWEVAAEPGLITGPARLTGISDGRVALDGSAAGPVEVRVRWAAHWRVVSGAARLREAPGGWTTVELDRPGPVSLEAAPGW